MLAPNTNQRLAGMDRGSSGLVNPGQRRMAPGLLPGAVPNPGAQPDLGLQRYNGPMVNAMATAPAAAPSPAPIPMPAQVQPPAGAVNPATATPAGVPMAPATPPAPTLKGVSVNGIDPTNDLRNSTIAPTNDVNRFDLVDQRLKNYDATALPQFQSQVRKTVSGNAGLGRLGSGMLNTDLGNETLAAENARNSYFGNLLTDASQGTITDAANNRAELRGERGYQTDAEKAAFDRSRQGVFDTEALTNSDFNRNLARTQTGFANDPSALIAQLSAMSGANASAGAAGVGASSANQSYIDMLKKILAGMGGGAATPQGPPPVTE